MYQREKNSSQRGAAHLSAFIAQIRSPVLMKVSAAFSNVAGSAWHKSDGSPSRPSFKNSVRSTWVSFTDLDCIATCCFVLLLLLRQNTNGSHQARRAVDSTAELHGTGRDSARREGPRVSSRLRGKGSVVLVGSSAVRGGVQRSSRAGVIRQLMAASRWRSAHTQRQKQRSVIW